MHLPSIYIYRESRKIAVSSDELEGQVIMEESNSSQAHFVKLRIRSSQEIIFDFTIDQNSAWLGYADRGFFRLSYENAPEKLLVHTQIACFYVEESVTVSIIANPADKKEFIFVCMKVLLTTRPDSFYNLLFSLFNKCQDFSIFTPSVTLKLAFASLARDFYEGHTGLADAMIAQILSEALSQLQKSIEPSVNAIQNPADEELAYLIAEQIILEMDEPWKLGKLAMIRHITLKKLKEIFKKYIGMPAAAFKILIRIEKARQLLEETDLPIQKISVQVGYPDPAHFSKLFRQKIGISPGQFRKVARLRDQMRQLQ